jgi:hypothetical protein
MVRSNHVGKVAVRVRQGHGLLTGSSTTITIIIFSFGIIVNIWDHCIRAIGRRHLGARLRITRQPQDETSLTSTIA